jgi:hypothetical protein
MQGFIFDEVAGTALTENDAAAGRVDSKRAIVGVIEDATTRGQRAAVSSAGALSSNLTQVAGATISQGNGTAATAIRVALPTDGTGVVGLSTGTNSIGDIRSITTSIIPGTSATHLGKAVDSIAGATDTGVASLAIRDDALATLTPVDGDYTNLRTNARGATWMAIEDGAGNQITSFGGGTQYTEDAVSAADPVGTVPIMVRKDTPATITSTDGDNIAQRATNYGAGYVQVLTSAGAFVDTFGGGTQFADGAARGTATGTLAMVDDGANIQSVLGDSSGRLFTNISQINAVTPLMGNGITGTGSLRVTLASDGTAISTVGYMSVKLDQTTPGTTNAMSLAQLGANTVATGNGASSTGVLRVAQVNDGTGILAGVTTVTTLTGTTTLTPGTAAANLGKAEDAVHNDGDVGVMALAVRKNTAASTSGADGDYQPIITNTRGASWVAIEDGAGGQITSFGGGTQYTEDVAAAADPIGTAPILVRKDTPAATVSTDGDNIAQRGTNFGASYVTLLDTSGNPVSVGGGTQYAEDTTHVTGDLVNMAGVVQQTADSALSSDGDRSLLQVDATGYLKVNVKAGVSGTQYAELTTTAPATATSILGRYNTTQPTLTNGQMNMPQLDANSNLIIAQRTIISTANSSTTPLLANATFTGTFENVVNYSAVDISTFTNSIATINGLQVQWSSDGTNVDRTTNIDIDINGSYVTLPTEGTYVRVKVNAGILDQTALRLQTVFITLPPGNKVTPLLDKLADDSSTAVTRALIEGKARYDTYFPIAVDDFGAIKISATTAGNFQQLGLLPSDSVAVSAPGVSLQSLAGPTGDPINTIGNALEVAVTRPVPVSSETGTVFNGSTPLTPKFGLISASGSGSNTLVTGVVGQKIRVLSYVITSNGTVNAKFQSSNVPTDISGLLYMVANTGASAGYNPVGHFETLRGESLLLNLSGAVAVGGHFTYIVV